MDNLEQISLLRDSMAVSLKAIGTLLELATSSNDLENVEISTREVLRRLDSLKRMWVRVEGLEDE